MSLPGLAIVGARAVFALARYLSDGRLDASFGIGGKLTTDFGGSDNRAFALVLQPDGKLASSSTPALRQVTVIDTTTPDIASLYARPSRWHHLTTRWCE